jgi:membrane-associated phospholipid phosphatase
VTAPILSGIILRRILIACSALFVGCMVLVRSQRTGTGADRFLFDTVIENRGQFIVDLARFIVPLGGILPLAALSGLCAGSLLIRRTDRLSAALAPMSLLVTGLVTSVLKDLVARSGPAAQLRRVIEPSNAFPSGHAALSSAVLVAIGLVITADAQVPTRIRRAVFITCAVLAGAVSWSTVALHMHWPTDAIGGSALGAAVACALCLALQSPRLRSWFSATRSVSNRA